MGLDGASRTLPIEELHPLPEDRPDPEAVPTPSDLVTAVHVPAGSWDRSLYLKVCDRASYAFALGSVAVALQVEEGRVREVRIALSGLAAKP